MLSRVSVYRSRRRYGWRRRAAWRDAGLIVHARRVRLAMYAQPWAETSVPLTPIIPPRPAGTDR